MRMRKLFFVLMSAFASLGAGAQTFFTQGNLLFTVNDESPTTVSVKKAFSDIGGEIVIPSTVVNEGVAYTVTLITGNAFDKTSITSITIPASVDSIGSRAFESCQSLTNIHIDDSDRELKLISGFYGFLYGADADKSVYVGRNLNPSENSAPFPNVTSVKFGDKVTAINPRLFYDADKLASVTIGSGVTEIGVAAFWDAGDDESVAEIIVKLGENVRTIGASAFEGCDKLMSITLPEKIDTIFDSAFQTTGLTDITIPASVDSIGNRAFADCKSLASIRIQESAVPLALRNGFYGTFYGSDADKSIYIGRDLRLNEENALVTGATSVEFGDKVTAINPRLFYDADKLVNVTIGSGVTEIGEAAFYDAGNTESVTEMIVTLGENVKTIGVSAFEGCDKLMSITLPEKIDTIFDSAFQTTGLTDITIPASVDSIGNRAFASCSSLASIRIQDSAVPLALRNGFYGTFYGSDADKGIYIGRDLRLNEENAITSNAKSVEFGDQVTTINPRLFYDDNKLAILKIGNGVKTIGNSAFYSSGDDESVAEMTVTLGENVKTIGVSAFEGCDKLMSITLPETLDTIFDNAFQTTGLTALTIPASVDSIGNRAFGNCSSLASIRIQESAVPLPLRNGFYGTFYGSDADKTVYIGRTLELNEENPIASNAKSVEFGDQVTTINPRLFYDDNKLAILKIGNGVKTIGNSAFYSSGDDESVAEMIVTLGENVKTIGGSAFEGCNNLKSLTLPEKLDTIFGNAFNSVGLTSLTIPASVDSIGDRAFASCSSLASIRIQDSAAPLALRNGFYGTFYGSNADYDLYLGRNLVYEDMESSPFSNVTSATIGSQVTNLPRRFFYDRDKLTAVTGAENVATMGTEVYKYCDNLESVELGSALKVLPESTFESCVKLAVLSLPQSLTEIQQWAIYNCQSLVELTIPASVQSIGKAASGENGYRTFYQDKGMRRLVIADSDQPLLLADTYGVFFRDMNQLESLYLGRNIVTEGNANQPFTAAREIEFGKGVTDIGLQLSGVTAQTVKAPWQTPIAINENAFNQATYSGATLWIPGGTKAAYAEATGWQKFLNVETTSYVLAIEASRGGSLTVGEVTVSGGEKVEMLIDGGASVTFTMRADEGYELTALTVDGRTVQTEGNTYVIQSLMNDINVVATYAPITYQIAYNLAGGVADNPLSYNIESETFTLVNPTREHYVFAGWTGTGLDKPAETVIIEKGSTGNREYTATWSPLDYAITYELDGGTLEKGNPTSYNIESETFTLVNPTREHYVFAGWTGTGLEAPTSRVTITKGSTGNRAYTATWERMTYSVTITGNGVSVDNESPKYGDTVVLTIMDDPDATLVSLTVNGVDVTAQIVNNRYVIERVEENITVEAVFRSLYEYVRMADRMATFSCPQDLNFTGSDVKAYIAAGYNKQEGEVLLVRVYDVPAGTGLVLKGEAGATYKVPYAESQSYYVNLLKAQLTAGTVAPTEGEASNFLLRAEADGEFRFGAVEAATRLAGQQAYLQVPTSFVAPGTSYVKIIFADEDPDAVERFTMDDGQSQEATYSLGGIKMSKGHLPSGVYIVNGKKVVVK